MNRVRLAALVLAGAVGGNVGAAALSPGQPATIQERARGAAKVVVATVVETSARYERNEFGDELIGTQAELAVEEAIKGSSEPVTMEIEGGTVDGITMRASDLPAIAKGERAVFFLTRGYGGSANGPKLVDADADRADVVGDEALLLARVAPTIVARDRVAGASAAKAPVPVAGSSMSFCR